MPMTGADVRFVLDALGNAGIEVVVGGGWGVDVLVGLQSRQHDDLDVYIDVARRAVDVHPLRFEDGGYGELTLVDGTVFRFPPDDLAARGAIGGRQVTCLTPQRQLAAHSGYEPTPRDEADMALLREHLGYA